VLRSISDASLPQATHSMDRRADIVCSHLEAELYVEVMIVLFEEVRKMKGLLTNSQGQVAKFQC
jgi:hypothetical protein